MRRMTGRVAGVVTLVVVVVAVVGCEQGEASWAGTVTDSAGVLMVHSPERGAWGSGESPDVSEDLAIGEAEGEPAYQFGRIAAIEVDEEGAIYVLDQQAREVRVFDSTGEYLRTVGRPGAGPGELSQATAGLLLGPGDTLLVPDGMLQRVTRFTRDGREAGSFPLSLQEGIPIRWASLPDRRLVQQIRRIPLPDRPMEAPQPDLLVVRTADGAIRDTLLQLPAGESFQMGSGGPRIRFFAPEPVWMLTEEGKLVSGRTDEYRVEVRSPDGTLERVITRSFEPVAVTEADRELILTGMREMMRAQGAPPQAIEPMLQAASFADRYPAFANMVSGPEGSLWLQRFRSAAELKELAEGGELDMQDMGSPTWDVFDGEGRYLGAVTLPDRFTPLKVRGNSFYGVFRDDLDVQKVVRLQVGGGADWSAVER